MGKAEALTTFANKEARKLGISTTLTVLFPNVPTANGKSCRLGSRTIAHAHMGKHDPDFGRICIKRGLRGGVRDWQDTIRHEVAHFAPGGRGHGVGFLKTRASQGSRSAKAALIQMGKAKCSRHIWQRGQEIERRADYRGLTVRYSQVCRACGTERPKHRA